MHIADFDQWLWISNKNAWDLTTIQTCWVYPFLINNNTELIIFQDFLKVSFR